MTDVDLFGDTPDISKGGTGYLAHLADLPYPDGLRFWALARAHKPKRLLADTTEMVWLVDADGDFLIAAINIVSGEILA